MKKSNNVQLLRFLAASLVIIFHAFPISGSDHMDIMLMFTDGRYHHIHVQTFFLFSGFFVARGLLRRSNVGTVDFLKGRLKRFIPPLAAVVFASVILCAFISELSFSEYFSNIQTYKYLLNSVFILIHDLPGVFQNNFYHTVNGSLWTMPVELICCILCYILYRMKLLNGPKILWTLPLVAGSYYLGSLYLSTLYLNAFRVGTMFYIGILYYVFWDRIKFTPWAIGLSTVAYFACVATNLPFVGSYIFQHYSLMGIGFYLPQCSEKISKLGDSSYCMYLWGWPVQQFVVYFFGGKMNPHLNYVISLPVTILLAWITHKLVEEKCLAPKTVRQ